MTELTAATIEFGTDGIRGIAGQFPLDPLTVLAIGRAIGVWLRSRMSTVPRVLIGRDTRLSGNYLSSTLTSGLLAEGIDVANAAVITTPGVAFLTRSGAFDLGIVVSASHNPFDQNGIKLFGPDGFKLADEAEEAIEALISGYDSHTTTTSMGRLIALGSGFGGEASAALSYVEHLTEAFAVDTLESLGVVLDCANGAASTIAVEAFRGVGAMNLVRLNAEPDGVNINVSAGSEHVRRDRKALHHAVVANHADLGIAFDGDADRVVFVTPDGTLLDGDHVLGILAVWLKERGQLKGDSVVVTDMSNSGLEHFLKEHGIALIRTRVGDRYVMDKLREGGYTLGGEQAGHIILLNGDHTAGDGIFIGLLVAAIAAQNRRDGKLPLPELARHIPRYPQVIASAHLSKQVDLKHLAGLDELRERTLTAFERKGRVNVRFSGTEPNLLRAMIEGGPQTSIRDVIDRALAFCNLVGRAADTPNPRVDLVDCATGAPIKL